MPRRNRLLVILAFLFLALLIGVFFATGSLRNLDSIRDSIAHVESYVGTHRTLAQLVFFLIYLMVAALAIPITLYLTLLGGALFGVLEGTLLSWIACAVGATLSFLIARHLLGNLLIDRLKKQLHLAQQHWAEDGLFYLFSVRLIPGFPFIVANFLMALLPVRPISFFLVSLAGMLPLTVVYSNAGFRLSELNSLEGILQPPLIFSLLAVGITPLILKKLLSLRSRRRALAKAPTNL